MSKASIIDMTLYEQLGGASAIDVAVDIFYRKVLEDYRINRFFDNTNMVEQIAKQKAFLTMAFGGPNNYNGKDLREAHARLVKMGLDNSSFDIVMEHLVATLNEFKVPEGLIHQVASTAEGTRDDVLGR